MIERARFWGRHNGWTGGQYSLYRLVFGAYLTVHFLQLLPYGAELWSSAGALALSAASPLLTLFPNIFALWDAPVFVTTVLALAAAASALFALGYRDRWAALFVWYVWACLFGRNPLISNPGLPYVGLLLIVHALLPSGAYGSFARRADGDPGHRWRVPQSLFVVVWALMALGYSYSGDAKLTSPSWVSGDAIELVLRNPLARENFLVDAALALPASVLRVATWATLGLELLFLPLALFARTRPFAWLALLLMHLGLMCLIDSVDVSLGMVMLHLFTFDPAWLAGRPAESDDRLYYDGTCGLCHGTVKFFLSEDRQGQLKYAPLDSDSFRARVPEDVARALPDSVVVVTGDGQLHTKSAAVLYLLARLGGLWRVIAALARLCPRRARDWLYDRVAARRKRWFKPAAQACPLLPVELRRRFES